MKEIKTGHFSTLQQIPDLLNPVIFFVIHFSPLLWLLLPSQDIVQSISERPEGANNGPEIISAFSLCPLIYRLMKHAPELITLLEEEETSSHPLHPSFPFLLDDFSSRIHEYIS
ncbi:hypothetical protein CDAR_591531 [Caerostris darwini]|uniref:Uncharacterized protein n=1 Tax=Caerostris darwini TaxID=1538125 RepID=A0AAV4PJ98_9ARAC|nr:hypothetical protein CDAR_591531 [Caerostris darwini]